MHHGLRRAFSAALIVIVLIAGMIQGSFAQSYGGRWVSIEGSNLEIFLPDVFEEARIGDSERESGYTAQYGYSGHQLGVGKWVVDAEHDFDDEFAYNLELYGEENVYAATANGLRTIFCKDPASNTLMLLYPDNAGSVFFAVGYPLDDDVFYPLCTTIFHSLRTAQKSGDETPADGSEKVQALMESAAEAIKSQDYAGAEKLYIEGFEQTGNPIFLFGRGYLYGMPDTGRQDYAKAVDLYEQAANAGLGEAMTNLGYIYSIDDYGMADYEKALDWYEKGAEAGDILSMYGLGYMYFDEKYGMTDPGKALQWFTKAAEAGDIESNYFIGTLLVDESYGLQDVQKGLEAFTICAENGDANAMNALVRIYENDAFGVKDSALADRWREEYKAATGEEIPVERDFQGDPEPGVSDVTVLGSGSTTFWVMVAIPEDDGIRAFTYEIHTDKTHLLDALLEVDLIAGEEASWGYNVTTVAGVRADYDEDGAYWSIALFDVDMDTYSESDGDLERPITYYTEEGLVPLETPIAYTEIVSGVSQFIFFYEQG